jgi:hypothetical protein
MEIITVDFEATDRLQIRYAAFVQYLGIIAEYCSSKPAICRLQNRVVLLGESFLNNKGKGKAIPLQAVTGPEGSRRLRLPDFKTIGLCRWQGYQPYAPAAFTPRKYSWYSFLLETESTPGP